MQLTEQKIIELMRSFNVEGDYLQHKTITNGLINTTELVYMEDQDGDIKRYILQKINKNVFKRPEDVMENIVKVTKFIRNKMKAAGEEYSRRVMKFYKANDGKYFTIDENGDYWRISKYIEKSVTFNSTDNLEVLEETGKAFGEFQGMLNDFPVEELNIIIPHFHNTLDRYRQLEEAIANDIAGRKGYVEKDIEAYLDLKTIATRLYAMQKAGQLPLRVTHNDTKSNNVLFELDKKTGKIDYLCAIDLDTIMPGLACYDFGDAVRFAANTCAEDEINTDRVKLDMEKYKALVKGFVSTAGKSLTKEEIETLYLGAITMTIECGSRFLADYLNGDTYFKTQYAEHNLVRARCQLALADNMIENVEEMKQIVMRYAKQYGINC